MRCPVVWPVVFLVAAALFAGSCGSASGRAPEAREGRLVVERVARAQVRVFDAPARATYCAGDSVLVILALDERWTAGLALRTAFPVPESLSLVVGPELTGEGSAAAAFRAVTDSVRPALVASAGTVFLDTGARASGRIDVTIPAASGDQGWTRLVGAFRSLPTADTAEACGTAARTP